MPWYPGNYSFVWKVALHVAVDEGTSSNVVGVTDTLSVSGAKTRELTDEVGVTDAFDYEITINGDAVGVTDSASGVITFERTFPNAVGITDNLFSPYEVYAPVVLADLPEIYWKLDEPFGPTAIDSSGNSHDGTYTGDPEFGVPGLTIDGTSAVHFSAVNPDGSYLLTDTFTGPYPNFTIETLINITAPSEDYFGFNGYYLSFEGGLYVEDDGTGSNFSLGGGWWSTGPNFVSIGGLTGALSYGTTYHVVVTYDGTIGKIYVDGTVALSGAVAGGMVFFNPEPFQIGLYSYGASPVTIDEVAFYDVAITSTDVSNHYSALSGTGYPTAVITNSPQFYYRMGESSGTSAVDASGNNVTGTYYNDPVLGVTGLLTGDSDTAVTFLIPEPQKVESSLWTANTYPAFTMELLYKPDAPIDTFYRTVMSWMGGDAYTVFEIRTASGVTRIIFYIEDDPSSTYPYMESVVGTADGDTIYHLAATYDGNIARLYVDGVQVDSDSGYPSGSLTLDTSDRFTVGGGPFADEAYGVYNHAAFYTYALTAGEILTHYQALTSPNTPELPNTVGVTDTLSVVYTRPSITSLSPMTGTFGTPVTITGTGLLSVTNVIFAGVSVSFVAVNNTTITVTAPGHDAGVVNVSLYDALGAIPGFVQFTYVTAPTFTPTSPGSGGGSRSSQKMSVRPVKNPTAPVQSISIERNLNDLPGQQLPRRMPTVPPTVTGRSITTLDVQHIHVKEVPQVTPIARETLIPTVEGYTQLPSNANIMPFDGSVYGFYWEVDGEAGLYKIIRDNKVATGYNTILFPASFSIPASIDPYLSMDDTTIIAEEQVVYPDFDDTGVLALRVIKRTGESLEISESQQVVTEVFTNEPPLIKCSSATFMRTWPIGDPSPGFSFGSVIQGLGVSGTTISLLSTSTMSTLPVDMNSWGQEDFPDGTFQARPIPVHFGVNHVMVIVRGGLFGPGFYVQAFDFTPAGGVTHWYDQNDAGPPGDPQPMFPTISAYVMDGRYIYGQNEMANEDVGFSAQTGNLRTFFGPGEIEMGPNTLWPERGVSTYLNEPYTNSGPTATTWENIDGSSPATLYRATGIEYWAGENWHGANQPNPVFVSSLWNADFSGGNNEKIAGHSLVEQNGGLLTNVTPDSHERLGPWPGQLDYSHYGVVPAAISPSPDHNDVPSFILSSGHADRQYIGDSAGTELCVAPTGLWWDGNSVSDETTLILVPFAFRLSTEGVIPGIIIADRLEGPNSLFAPASSAFSFSFDYEVTFDPTLPIVFSIEPPFEPEESDSIPGLPPGFSLDSTGLLTYDGGTPLGIPANQTRVWEWTLTAYNGEAFTYVNNILSIHQLS